MSFWVLAIALIAVCDVQITHSFDQNSLHKNKYLRPAGIPFPENNPYSPDKAELGKMLFFDPRLSVNNEISCATCHNQEFSWEDGKVTSTGHKNETLSRHTPTLLNLAWGDLYFWDGRAETLEEQAIGPIENPDEMGQDVESLIKELETVPAYNEAFQLIFPSKGITRDTIAKAIATFERTIVSGVAPFDEWVTGDETSISAAAKRGFALFNGKAKCSSCHEGWNFSDLSFHDIGLKSGDVGRYAILNIASLKNSFKTPTLRNIAERAPYMHDGSLATLEAVIDHYNDGFVNRDSLSPEMSLLGLSHSEKQDLKAFLQTLSSDDATDNLPQKIHE